MPCDASTAACDGSTVPAAARGGSAPSVGPREGEVCVVLHSAHRGSRPRPADVDSALFRSGSEGVEALDGVLEPPFIAMPAMKLAFGETEASEPSARGGHLHCTVSVPRDATVASLPHSTLWKDSKSRSSPSDRRRFGEAALKETKEDSRIDIGSDRRRLIAGDRGSRRGCGSAMARRRSAAPASATKENAERTPVGRSAERTKATVIY